MKIAEQFCRNHSTLSWPIFSPLSVTNPVSGAYNPVISLASVDFPLPLPPTMKLICPGSKTRSSGPS